MCIRDSYQAVAEHVVVAQLRRRRCCGDADGEADDLRDVCCHGDRPRTHGLQDAQRHALGVDDAALLQQHGKFIAAEARARIAGAHLCADAPGDFMQHRIACKMAEAIVDLFEVINVDHQQ